MTTDDVISQIEKAFEKTPPPGDLFDDISATQRDEGIVEYFRGKTWKGHRVQDLLYHSCALSFFTDKAFRYWLPAFMLAELETPGESDIIGEAIAFSVTDGHARQRRLQEFSEGEREGIIAFLNECAGRHYDGVYDCLFRQASNSVRESRATEI